MENKRIASVVIWLMYLFRCTSLTEVEPDWETIFNSRSFDEWQNVWHSERHRRCFGDLPNHLNLVCEKDIYKVPISTISKNYEKRDGFLPIARAYRFDATNVKSRRQKLKRYRRGITEECCMTTDGCSWEEYAEYCPLNSRSRD